MPGKDLSIRGEARWPGRCGLAAAPHISGPCRKFQRSLWPLCSEATGPSLFVIAAKFRSAIVRPPMPGFESPGVAFKICPLLQGPSSTRGVSEEASDGGSGVVGLEMGSYSNLLNLPVGWERLSCPWSRSINAYLPNSPSPRLFFSPYSNRDKKYSSLFYRALRFDRCRSARAPKRAFFWVARGVSRLGRRKRSDEGKPWARENTA
ncbi:hypothetical protein AOLI_G00190110 [Acnodon oligacanthus]